MNSSKSRRNSYLTHALERLQDDYNILQFSIGRISDPITEDLELKPGEEVEYLIENPEKDFRKFIEKISPEDYDIDLLTKLFSEAVKRVEDT